MIHRISATNIRIPLVDYTKLLILRVNSKLLLDNPLLEFTDIYDQKGKRKGRYKQAKLKNLIIKLYYDEKEDEKFSRITIEGSLHKYWNNGEHNYNDFGLKELLSVIKDIEEKLGIMLGDCKILQLEIGVNLKVDFKVEDFIRGCLFHSKKPIEKAYTKQEGHYYLASHQRYKVKIYNKGLQYRLKEELLRFEIKYNNMEDLRKVEQIYTVNDLLELALDNFIPILKKTWNEVLFYEKALFENTKYKDTYSNPNYWIGLEKENFKYHRKNLNKITATIPNNLKERIANMIEEKSQALTNLNYPN